MRVTKTEMVEHERVEDVLCNGCGESCSKRFADDVKPEFYGLVEQVVHGGYLSSNDENGLSDMTSYTFSLCEKCLRKLFNTFKIPAEEVDFL